MSLTFWASVSLLALVSNGRPLPEWHDEVKAQQLFLTGTQGDSVLQSVEKVAGPYLSAPQKLFDEQYDEGAQIATVDQTPIRHFLPSEEERPSNGIVGSATSETHTPDEGFNDSRLSRDAAQIRFVSEDAITAERGQDTQLLSDDASSEMGEDGQYTSPGMKEESGHLLFMIIVTSCALALLGVACVAIAMYLVEVAFNRTLPSLMGILPYARRSKGLSFSNRDLIGFLETTEGEDVNPPKYSLLEPHVEKQPIGESGSNILKIHVPIVSRIFDDVDKEEELLSHTHAHIQPPLIEEKALPSDHPPSSAAIQIFPPVGCIVREPPKPPAVPISPLPDSMRITSEDMFVPGGLPVGAFDNEMKEVSLSRCTRPSWSIRASEFSSLQSTEREQRHGYGQYTVPGLDAALAMQLRPGLGVGADAAWLVRFVMALFG